MCLRFTIKQLRILYSHTYDQLAARARAERQRAARARVGHPAGAAGAAAAAAACPGARRTADPARAPRQVRVLDAPHVCAACPALALAQGGAPRAFLVGLGSLTAPRAGQQLQAAVQHATHRSTRARHPTRSAVVPTRGGRCAASLGCPRLPRRRHSAAPGMAVEVDQLIEHVRRAREPRHDRRVPTPHARLRLARLGLGGRQQLPSPAAAVLARSPTDAVF